MILNRRRTEQHGGSFSFGSMTGSGYVSASQDKTAGRRGFSCGQQRQQKILQTEGVIQRNYQYY